MPVACGILVPLPGIAPVPSAWEGRCWTTREGLRGFVKSRAGSVDLQQSRRFCLSSRHSGGADAAPGGVGASAPGLALEVIAGASFIIGHPACSCAPAAWHALTFSAKPL